MTTAKRRYDELSSGPRQQFLQRARHNATLTIPSLMPLDGHDQTSHLIEPYQGFGAMAVGHLASRMTSALLPASRPYMRLSLPPQARMQNDGVIPPDVERGMALSEQIIQAEVERSGWRPSTNMEMLQLINNGSVAERINDDNTIRVFRLDRYVVRRNHNGQVLEFVIEEKFKGDALKAEIGTIPSGIGDDEDVSVFTWGKYTVKGNRRFYVVAQYVDDDSNPVPGTEAEYPVDLLPYLFHDWQSNPGEDYGRSKVSDHVGDLRTLEVLTKNMLEMAAMAGRHFLMVRPGAGGFGLKSRISQAANGDVIVGNPEDVDTKSFVAGQGYQLVQAHHAQLLQSLSRAFLLLSAGQRNADRVTATEIERDIDELEAALGGVFSTLSGNMMFARTRLLIANMQRDGKLPEWDKDEVDPVILTGLEALSRQRDVIQAESAAQLINMFGEQAIDVIKLPVVLSRAFVGLGMPDAVRTQDEFEEEQQRKADLQMQQEVATAGLSAAAAAPEE